jgi:transposase-like protein
VITALQCAHLRDRYEAKMLQEAADDVIGLADFPVADWNEIWSTNRWRVIKEIKHRTDVVGVYPNPAALLRRRLGAGQNPKSETSRLSENSMTSSI